jgi:methionyl-tRNA synthetase
LVATWGNLANRVLSFCNKYWEGQVPDPGELTDLDTDLLKTIEEGFETVGDLIDEVKLRAAAAEAMRLASEVNKYLDMTAPWQQVKTDKATAARAIFTALKAIDSLKILFAPFLPFTSDRLHGYMGHDGSLFGTQKTEILKDELGEHKVLRYDPSGATGKWEPSKLKAGDPLRQPVALFKKLDISIVEEERARLGNK